MTRANRNEPEPKRYGGEYDGYWIAPATEPWMREQDARGLAAGVTWLVYIAYLDRKLVWC